MCYRWSKTTDRGEKREVFYAVHLSESTQLHQDSNCCISQETGWSRGRPFISVDSCQRKTCITEFCSWWTWWKMNRALLYRLQAAAKTSSWLKPMSEREVLSGSQRTMTLYYAFRPTQLYKFAQKPQSSPSLTRSHTHEMSSYTDGYVCAIQTDFPVLVCSQLNFQQHSVLKFHFSFLVGLLSAVPGRRKLPQPCNRVQVRWF